MCAKFNPIRSNMNMHFMQLRLGNSILDSLHYIVRGKGKVKKERRNCFLRTNQNLVDLQQLDLTFTINVSSI